MRRQARGGPRPPLRGRDSFRQDIRWFVGSVVIRRIDMSTSIAAMTSQLVAQRCAPRIVSMELILCEACNMSCSYCFEYDADRRQTMGPATAQKAVDFLMDASRDSSWVEITFMGGEPTLCSDRIREVVAYARRRGAGAGKQVHFNITTNGLALRKDHLEFFRSSGVRVCLSLDGGREDNDRHRRSAGGQGTFDEVAGKIRLLKQFQPWLGTRMTIMPDTAANLAENIRVLHEDLAVNQFILGFATGVVWSDEQVAGFSLGLKRAFEYYLGRRLGPQGARLRVGLLEVGPLDEVAMRAGRRRWGCGAGSGRLAVAPDGTFHGCSKLAWAPGGSKAAPLPLGTVETGLRDWQNRLKLLNHTEQCRPKCRACRLANRCNGGCYAANYAETRDLYTPSDTYCKLIRAQVGACDYGRRRLGEPGLSSLVRRNGNSAVL